MLCTLISKWAKNPQKLKARLTAWTPVWHLSIKIESSKLTDQVIIHLYSSFRLEYPKKRLFSNASTREEVVLFRNVIADLSSLKGLFMTIAHNESGYIPINPDELKKVT